MQSFEIKILLFALLFWISSAWRPISPYNPLNVPAWGPGAANKEWPAEFVAMFQRPNCEGSLDDVSAGSFFADFECDKRCRTSPGDQSMLINVTRRNMESKIPPAPLKPVPNVTDTQAPEYGCDMEFAFLRVWDNGDCRGEELFSGRAPSQDVELSCLAWNMPVFSFILIDQKECDLSSGADDDDDYVSPSDWKISDKAPEYIDWTDPSGEKNIVDAGWEEQSKHGWGNLDHGDLDLYKKPEDSAYQHLDTV